MGRPHRNNRISYVGRSTFLVTIATRERVKAFADIEFGRAAERALRDKASKTRFALPAYCLMPDHIHLVATGQAHDSDLKRLIEPWKQATGFTWSKLGHARLWEEGYWDRLARFDESVDDMIRYVIENPVRAKLATEPARYPLTGSTEHAIEEICLRCMPALKCRPSGIHDGDGTR